MGLSRSATWWQPWALRAIAALLAVYMLGTFGIPTFIPYIAVLIFIAADLLRQLVQRTRRDERSW
jgi:hypothetical protein